MRAKWNRSASSRGATLIEFALIFPILILIVIAIMELGMAFKDYLTVSAISREATRIAGIAGNQPDADCAVLRGVGATISTGDLARLEGIQIFRANEDTGAQIQADTNVALYNGGDPTVCTVPANPALDGWDLDSTGWPPTSRQTIVGDDPLDVIGVRVVLTRSWITGFPPFSGSMTIDESTITRVEPTAFDYEP